MNQDFFPSAGEESKQQLVTGKNSCIDQFVLLVLMGNVGKIKEYFSKYCQTTVDMVSLLNAEDEFGRGALFYAVARNLFDVVEYLCSKGANLRQRDFKGRSLLHYAVQFNVSYMLQKLIDLEGIFSKKIKESKSSQKLLRFSSHGSEFPGEKTGSDLKLLKRNNLDYSFEKEYFESKEFNNNQFCLINAVDYQGVSALHVAALGNDIVSARFLIENHACLFLRDHENKRPVDVVSSPETQKYIRLQMNRFMALFNDILPPPLDERQPLSKHILPKANLNRSFLLTQSVAQLSQYNISPLHRDNYLTYAMRYNKREAVLYLLHRGVCPYSGNLNWKTPLHYAVEFDNLDITRIILEGETAGDKTSKKCPWVAKSLKVLEEKTKLNELTPYHIAAMRGNILMLEYLEKISQFSLKNLLELKAKDFYTPALLAARENQTKTFLFLASKGADIFVQNTKMQNALHMAVINRNLDLVKWIMSKDMEECKLKNQRDYKGRTPTQYDKTGEFSIHLFSIWESIRDNNLEDIYNIIVLGKNTSVLELRFSKSQDTPLHYAVRLSRLEVIKVFLASGASIELKNSEGLTVIELARKVLAVADLNHIIEALSSSPNTKEIFGSLSTAHTRSKNFKRNKISNFTNPKHQN